MTKEKNDNALKAPTESALTDHASWRASIQPQDFLSILGKRPDRSYYFVNKVQLDKYGGVDRRGWQPLNESNAKGESLGSVWGHSGGTCFQVGDLVAAWMPKEIADQRKIQLKNMTNDLKKESVKQLRNQAKAVGAVITGHVETERNGIVNRY